ncbi:diguanylate cyclase [Loktanella agnita]|uniref:sensor domain-containing diguanylate cyclase n=1 Tax=Loktanella agnita TaxID=287097 RepID=UPI003987A3C9
MLQDKSIKPETTIQLGDSDARASDDRTGRKMLVQVLDALEQGIIFWSDGGRCSLNNDAVFDVLELEKHALQRGSTLVQFLTAGAERGEFTPEQMKTHLSLYAAQKTFCYDATLPSGRTVSASVRPVRDGGHVVAYTDVTAERTVSRSLATAKADAEEAQRRAAEVLQHERARQREASLLAQLDEWLQSCKSLEELYRVVTAFMYKVLPGTQGQLFIYTHGRDVLEQVCAWNSALSETRVTPDSCWALRRGRSYTYHPDELSFVCDHVQEVMSDDVTPDTYTCVPIMAHGDTVGLMHIEFRSEGDNPEVIDSSAFTARCAEHISMAIANVKLRDELQDQSTRDPLTGLYNRRYFLDELRKELSQTASRQGNFALITLDADRFKSFNDDHGHDAGDAVLEALAEKMLALDAGGLTACRVGGEEFSLIVPNADRTRAGAVIEELRQVVEDMRVKYIGGPLPKVTISAGVSIYPTHGTDPQGLIKAADVALYEAKDAGRNCWRVADSHSNIMF